MNKDSALLILCYWNGRISEGPAGIDYNDGENQLLKVNKQITFTELVDKIHAITKWDKATTKVSMTGRYCLRDSPRWFVGTPIVNNESLSSFVETLQSRKLDCIELYLRSSRIESTQNPNQNLLSRSYMCPIRNVIPGPKDPSVLRLQKEHRSSDVWEKEGDPMDQTVRSRCGRVWFPHPNLHRYIMEAGFLGVLQVQAVMLIDHSLMTALAERWRQETHTFHFVVGEMTITLQDVAMLLGLPIDGEVVTGTHCCDWAQLCQDELGLRPRETDITGSSLQLKWISDNFTVLPEADNYEVEAYDKMLKQFAKAWLLAAIGCVLCPNSSGDTVSLFYLSHLVDLTKVREYSWGSAVLANLYRGLCRASKRNVKEFSGCALLLQLWSWERLHIGRPIGANVRGVNEDAHVVVLHPDIANNPYSRVPYGHRWNKKKTFLHNPRYSVHYFRSELDSQKIDEVQWQPYAHVNELEVTPLCFAGRSIWRARVPLICYDVVEWHFSDRVLRQFGLPQGIPISCNTEPILHSITKRGRHKTDWGLKHLRYVLIWGQRRNLVVDADAGVGEPRREWSKYLRWYRNITRLVIARPQVPNQETPSLQYHNKSALWDRLVDTMVEIVHRCEGSMRRSDVNMTSAAEGFHDVRSMCISALTDAGEMGRLVDDPPEPVVSPPPRPPPPPPPRRTAASRPMIQKGKSPSVVSPPPRPRPRHIVHIGKSSSIVSPPRPHKTVTSHLIQIGESSSRPSSGPPPPHPRLYQTTPSRLIQIGESSSRSSSGPPRPRPRPRPRPHQTASRLMQIGESSSGSSSPPPRTTQERPTEEQGGGGNVRKRARQNE